MSRVTQCDLKSGTWRTTSWIPADDAVIGKVIRLRGDGKDWTVATTYATVDRVAVRDAQHNSKDIWKATSGNSPIGHK